MPREGTPETEEQDSNPVTLNIQEAPATKKVLEALSVSEAVKELVQFWPFVLRHGVHTVSAGVMSYIIAQKEVDLLSAYAAYQSAIGLAIGLLYSSIFPVVTLISNVKTGELTAIEAAIERYKKLTSTVITEEEYINNDADVKKARENIRSIWRQGILFSTALSVPAITFGLTASPLFELFKQPDIVLQNSKRFMMLSTPGFVADIFYRLTARTVSGLGVKKSILVADTIDAFFELVLAYTFLNGKFGAPELGIAGVGLAYTISKVITLLAHLAYMFLSPARLKFNYKPYGLFQLSGNFFNKDIFLKLIKAGIPDGMSSVLSGIASMLVVMFCGQYGTAPLVGLQTATVYHGFANFHMSAVLNAACSKIGGYYDILKNEKKEFSESSRRIALCNTKTYTKLLMTGCFMISAIAFGLSFLIPHQLASVLVDNTDESKQKHLSAAVSFLKIQGVFELLSSLSGSSSCVLESFLDNRFLFIATILFDLIANPGAAAIARYGMKKDAEWVYAASGVGAMLMTIAYTARCYILIKNYTQSLTTTTSSTEAAEQQTTHVRSRYSLLGGGSTAAENGSNNSDPRQPLLAGT